jgi:hypothetical protein
MDTLQKTIPGVKLDLHAAALQYISEGRPIFPCLPDGKKPATQNGFKDASADRAVVDAWWRDNPNYNIGAVPEDFGQAVVDLDAHKDGIAAWAALDGDKPDTFTVATPRGGRHLYYAGSLPGTVDRLAPGVDTRGVGTYVLLPPSVVGGKAYAVIKDGIEAPLPEWISAALRREPREASPPPDGFEVDQPRNVYRAIQSLNFQDEAVELQGSDNETIAAANVLGDLGLSCEKAAEVMQKHFKLTPVQPDRDEWIAEKVRNAYASRQNEIGCRALQSAEKVFAHVLLEWIEDEKAKSEQNAGERPFSAKELAAGTYPRVDYLVDGLVMRAHVNLLYGDGGTGKTILAEHMGVAIAAGVPLFGSTVKQAPVLMILAEDGYGETKARLQGICLSLGQVLGDLPLTLWCEPNDPLLAHIDDLGNYTEGPFMPALRRELNKVRGGFVVLDTVSDIAALDETKRLPVNALCKRVLRGLCKEFDVTILVNAHPSKKAMEDGSNYAGSTAWNNAVRNRLSLTRIKDADRSDPRRVLKVEKANYGAEVALDLHLAADMTFRLGAMAGRSESDIRLAVLETVVDLLNKGVNVVRTQGSGHNASDLADIIRHERKISIDKREVLKILKRLETEGNPWIEYHTSDGHGGAGYALIKRRA